MNREVFLCILAMGCYRRLNLVGLLCALALPLAGCGGSDDAGSAAVAIPAVVQRMDAEFPADGKIHVQSRGVFAIKPATSLCSFQEDGRVYESSFAEYRTQIERRKTSIDANGTFWPDAQHV